MEIKVGRRWRHWGLFLGGLAMFAVVLFFLVGVDGDGNYEKTPVSRRRALGIEGGEALTNSIGIFIEGQNEAKMGTKTPNRVVMDNGIVQLTFAYPGGDIIGIKYNGIDNVLEFHNKPSNRGYWDLVWSNPGEKIRTDYLQGTKFKVVAAGPEQIELSFANTYNVSLPRGATVPFNVDRRYILQRGRSGFYAYTRLERLEGWPAMDMEQIRIVFKLQQAKFRYMAISDNIQKVMPSARDTANGRPLAYREAVLLTNPSNPELRGEVDDKYQYSMENRDNRVHGWICSESSDPPMGFWMITPSDEFRSNGPMKQELTSHVGPTTLNAFFGGHYAGEDVTMKFEEGEAWKKVYGPVFVYLNSAPRANESTLWANAKEQMHEEVKNWPYNFIESEDFPSSDQRGSVAGQLLVRDRYINESLFWASSAYVGLAAPGDAGSWQRESKGYQFWTEANKQGYFLIKNVRPGNYSLYAWVPGVIGDYKYEANITIEPGSEINLANLTFEPPRNGPTLWEIGIPDRTAAEFYIPDPNPTLMNKLFTNKLFMNKLYNSHPEKFRQYGLWQRYTDLYPDHDLIYNVGTDNYRDDWFFAHVTRNKGDNYTYEATTWQIVFELNNVTNHGHYTLQLALASATYSEVQVRFNNRSIYRPHFTTGLIGRDNAIARHGIHGLYWLFSFVVPSYRLHEGNNTIYLTQSRSKGPFQGVMYDYIRLEGPPQS